MIKRVTILVLLIGTMMIAASTASAQWNVQAAVAWGNGKVYFFDGTQYSRYDIKSATIESTAKIAGNFASGYPQWDRIDAATRIGNTVYLFRGRQYVRYNSENGKIDGSPQEIEGNFTGNFPRNWDSIDAAVNLGNGIIYLFKGRTYVRYRINEGRIDGSPQPIAGNFAKNWVSWSKVDAAVNYGNGNVYFFSGSQYFRYNIANATTSTPQDVIGNFSKNGMRAGSSGSGNGSGTSGGGVSFNGSLIKGLGGKCLEVSGNGAVRVQMGNCHGRTNQRWNRKGAQIVGYGNKCLTTPPRNGDLYMAPCSGGDDQTWFLQTAPGGQVWIKSALGQQCMDVARSDTRNGASVIVWSCTENPNQKWSFNKN